MLALTLHIFWFTMLVILLEYVTGVSTPVWIIAAMATTYVAILFTDRETLTEAWAWVKTQADKFSSQRW